MSGLRDGARITDADLPNQRALELLMKMSLLLAVERLGGSLELTIDEVDNGPRGKRLDMTFDQEARTYTFTVVRVGG